MIRSLRQYTLLLLLITTCFGTFSQNEGVPQPEENALDLAFQKPERWTGGDYKCAYTFLERSYVMVGIGTDGIWGMSDLFGSSTNGFYGSLGFGHWVAPIHGYEVGFNYGLLPALDWGVSRLGTNYFENSYTKYFNFSASYLFNITSYAQRLQRPERWEWVAKVGFDLRFQEMQAMGVHTALRCQYNFTPEVGIYLEPQLGMYGNALDNEKLQSGYPIHILPAVSAGLSVKLERSEGYRRKGYVEAPERVKAYIHKRGTDRGKLEQLFGRRLNEDIIADTLSKADIARIAEEEAREARRADSLRRVVLHPTDSAGLAKMRFDSLRLVMIRVDSLKQIAIMRKDSAGRATLRRDSLQRLEAFRADSMLRAEAARVEADSLAKVEYMVAHKYECGKVALSTNMLYWAFAMPNIGVELPLNNHFSLSLEYMCPWFANRSAGFSYRLVNFELEGKYWFSGETKLRGLYVGLYGSTGYYDFEQEDEGHLGNDLMSGGLSLGYSLPMGRTISLEMSLGFGMLSTTYSNYHEDDGYLVYDSTQSFGITGPTKATIGIIWSPEFKFRRSKMQN